MLASERVQAAIVLLADGTSTASAKRSISPRPTGAIS